MKQRVRERGRPYFLSDTAVKALHDRLQHEKVVQGAPFHYCLLCELCSSEAAGSLASKAFGRCTNELSFTSASCFAPSTTPRPAQRKTRRQLSEMIIVSERCIVMICRNSATVANGCVWAINVKMKIAVVRASEGFYLKSHDGVTNGSAVLHFPSNALGTLGGHVSRRSAASLYTENA